MRLASGSVRPRFRAYPMIEAAEIAEGTEFCIEEAEPSFGKSSWKSASAPNRGDTRWTRDYTNAAPKQKTSRVGDA